MNTPVPSSGTPHLCGTCAHFIRRADDRLSAISAYRNCRYLPTWQYVSPGSACRFNPSKWEARKNAA